jgi:hypothetical protein
LADRFSSASTAQLSSLKSGIKAAAATPLARPGATR